MKLAAKELRLVPASKGVYCSFYVRDPGEMEQQIRSLSDSDVWVEISKMQDVRSLSANAYFHVLVGKLAAALGNSLDDQKKHLVLRYGALKRDKNGKYIGAQIPKGQNIDDIYPYCKWIGDTSKFDQYLFMKQTHTLTKDEMGKLIDGTISECKEQGIETLPPDELAVILSKWVKNDREMQALPPDR